MSEAKDQSIALNVRLKPSDSSAHPRATNYTNVGVAQGIAYLDFGFIEPALLAAIAKPRQKDWMAPSSPVWPWGWMCWRACISRYSKYWSACAMRGSRNQKRRIWQGKGGRTT